MKLAIEGLRFSRDQRVIVEIPQLSFGSNRTTAILGPNGAGKTTLLRLIAALERPAQGRITSDGQPQDRSVTARHRLALVFQEQVFLDRSVRENLDVGLRLRGLDPADRRRRVEDAAELLGIANLLDRPANRLSAGEGRRASLARALCLRAPLVLLDEPLAGLDASSYERLRADLPRILAAFGATTLLVTHDRNEALGLADDLVVLVGGTVRKAGSKRDVALNPGTTAVAEALGCSVVESNGRRLAIPPDGLALGHGVNELMLFVDARLDLVDAQEIIGRIGATRVRLTVSSSIAAPKAGEQLVVHAPTAVQVDV